MVVGGVCAHGATNLFRRGQYPLLEGLLAGVSAHGELQELAVGRGCLRDPLPRRDLAYGILSRSGIWPPAFPCAGRGGSRKQTVVLRTTFFVAHPVPYANKFATVLSGHKKTDDLHHPSVCFRAENGIRTRGPQLGKLMLYQLSYFRKSVCKCKNFLEGFKGESHLFNTHCGGRVYFSYENCREEHDEHYCCECNEVHREYCAPFKVDGYV